MTELAEIIRPSIALTKLIEITGILIGAHSKNNKTKYKIPLPSNYANTVTLLSENLGGVVTYISQIVSSDISKEIASQIYLKTREEGFDYEEAMIDGGIELNNLFPAVQEIMKFCFQLCSSSSFGTPLGCDLILAMTNDKPSYAMLDTAAHFLGHGSCKIMIYIDESKLGSRCDQTLKYLSSDLNRRCQNQYKIVNSNYTIETFIAQGSEQVLKAVVELVRSSDAKVLCLGMNENNIGLDGPSPLLMWAVWKSPLDVLLTPGDARLRPFNFTHTNWIILIYHHLNSEEKLSDIFQKSFRFIRPGDFIVFVISAEERVSRGDNRETRFEFGARMGWSTESTRKSCPFDSGDKSLKELLVEVQDLLLQLNVDGIVRVERELLSTTIAQQLCKVCLEERADLIIIKKNAKNRNMIVDCVQESPCSVVILK